MALTLKPPRTIRSVKNGVEYWNRHQQLVGTFRGRRVNVSTGETDPVKAEEFRIDFESGALKTERQGGPTAATGEDVTFLYAADAYVVAKDVSTEDTKRVERLKTQPEVKGKTLRQVTQDDINKIAKRLYPTSIDSQIRSVYTLMAAILHYGAEDANDWCPYRRIEKPPPPPKRNRLPAPDAYAKLAAATAPENGGDPKQSLFIDWLFRQGRRVTEYLNDGVHKNSGILVEHIDLGDLCYETHVSKSNHWQVFELDEVCAGRTANDADFKRGGGPLFPWRTRHQVYAWLNPLCERLGLRVTKEVRTAKGHKYKKVVSVKMTPHRARHLLGTQLAADHVHQANIQGILGHRDRKSTDRYVHADRAAMRGALATRAKRLDTVQALPPAKKERA